MNSKTDLPQPYIPKANVPQESELKKVLFPKFQEDVVKTMKKQKIKFSFHFLDLKDPLFCCGEIKINWFTNFFDNLQSISNLDRNEFTNQRQHYDLHELKWNKNNYTKKTFSSVPSHILKEIDPSDQLQFRLSTSSGRIHGFFIINTFYIVWLDPYHNLDVDYRFGGPKYFDAPLSPYQSLEVSYNSMCEKYDALAKENKALETYSYELLEQIESKERKS